MTIFLANRWRDLRGRLRRECGDDARRSPLGWGRAATVRSHGRNRRARLAPLVSVWPRPDPSYRSHPVFGWRGHSDPAAYRGYRAMVVRP